VGTGVTTGVVAVVVVTGVGTAADVDVGAVDAASQPESANAATRIETR